MNTLLASVVQQPTSTGSTFRTGNTRHAVDVGSVSLPFRNDLSRSLAAVMLMGAAVVGLMSPAHANQLAPPFGIPCNGNELNGNPYVPGVNCRRMVS